MGRREPGAGIVSTNPAMPVALLAAALAQAGAHRATGLQEGELRYGTAHLQGEMMAKGPGVSALQHQSADTRSALLAARWGGLKTGLGGDFQKDLGTRCAVQGSKGSAAHWQPYPSGTCSAGTD